MEEMTRLRPQLLAPYDHDGLEEYLGKRSEEGWLPDGIGRYGIHYHRAEPRARSFAVIYCPDASSFDPEPTGEQKRFQDRAEEMGWQEAASWGEVQIFTHQDTDAPPLETDPAAELERIHRMMEKRLILFLFLILIGILGIGHGLFSSWQEPVSFLADAWEQAMCFICLSILLYFAWEAGSYLSFRRRAKREAERGEFCSTKRNNEITLCFTLLLYLALFLYLLSGFLTGGTSGGIFASSYLLFSLILLPIIYLGGDKLSNILKRRKVDGNRNMALTVLIVAVTAGFVCFLVLSASFLLVRKKENLPLEDIFRTDFLWQEEVLLDDEDLGIELPLNPQNPFHTVKESLLAGQRWESQWKMRYTINLIKVPFFKNWCRERLLTGKSGTLQGGSGEAPSPWQEIPAKEWGALQAFTREEREGEYQYLLEYDKGFVQIWFAFEPDSAQRAKTGERLGSLLTK